MIECPSCRRHLRSSESSCPFCRSSSLDRVKTAVGIGLTTLVLAACYGPVDGSKPTPTGETGDTAPTTGETTPE